MAGTTPTDGPIPPPKGPSATPLTAEIQEAIVNAVATGANRVLAAQAVGVTSRTLRRWMAKGRAGDPVYRPLVSAVKNAEAAAVNRMVKVITDAAETTWTAAAWYLERTRSELYGRDTRLLRELADENAKLRAELAARGSLTPSRVAALPLPGQSNGNGSNGHGSNGNGHSPGGNGTNGNGKH